VDFSLPRAKAVLTRTPATLSDLLDGLPEEWTASNEGPDTWSPYQTLCHMTYLEESDWIDRTMTILADGGPRHFEPVDRVAGFSRFDGWTLADLLDHFREVRTANLDALERAVSDEDLARTGLHPDFGLVTLAQLLATWVVHDLNHLDQIAKTMAKQFTEAVGPWRVFLPIIDAT
jgi:hypothetical protein